MLALRHEPLVRDADFPAKHEVGPREGVVLLPAHSGTEVVVVGCADGEASLGGYALTMQSAWWSSR